MLSLINLDSKYIQAISNADIDIIRDLRLTSVKKYWRRVSQIKEEVNGLHKDQILALAAFVKHSQRMDNNQKVTENIKIRREVDPKWALSFFIQLYGFIYYQKTDSKNIADAIKLVEKLVQCLLVWDINGRLCQDYIWIEGKEPMNEPTNKRKP